MFSVSKFYNIMDWAYSAHVRRIPKKAKVLLMQKIKMKCLSLWLDKPSKI